MSKNRRPKIALFRQGKCQEENGEQEKAERFYLEALEASSRMSGSGSDSIPREQLAEEIRRENIRIHLALGSLYTDMGRAVLARERLSIVAELLPRKASFQKAQRVLLRSKIDFLDGRYRPVVTRLEKFLLDEKPQRHLERWLRDRKELRNAWEEALALLTLAAWKAGLHDVVDEVLPVAESFGVDMQVVREARAER